MTALSFAAHDGTTVAVAWDADKRTFTAAADRSGAPLWQVGTTSGELPTVLALRAALWPHRVCIPLHVVAALLGQHDADQPPARLTA
ncbi:hypothetical protein ACWEN6_13785 [Sphaerisporangium sp. NPDC004334]